ncbi:MAG: TatD family hydrolase [Myxococcales bacterium]|nr:TatD family hydrolase [Myxococcales bacterium]
MTTPLIDSHAHLDFDRFDDDREAVLQRAVDAGVDAILTIGTDLASSRRAVALAAAWPRIYASVGVHPHEADAFDDADWPELTALFADPRVRAVGETGLDYYYDFSDRGRQQALFRRHLQLCGAVGRPVVVHIRDAFDDAWALVAEEGLPAGGVVHCFTGGPAECERALALGFHVSLSGVVTFRNAKPLREAVTLIPPDRLLIETDAPFLAPVPHRGKRNEPSFVVHTAQEVAALRGETFEAVAAQTRANTIQLFGLPDPQSVQAP